MHYLAYTFPSTVYSYMNSIFRFWCHQINSQSVDFAKFNLSNKLDTTMQCSNFFLRCLIRNMIPTKRSTVKLPKQCQAVPRLNISTSIDKKSRSGNMFSTIPRTHAIRLILIEIQNMREIRIFTEIPLRPEVFFWVSKLWYILVHKKLYTLKIYIKKSFS